MDNLKKHLQQHLEEMDTDVPGEAVWQKIQRESTLVLPKRNVVKMVWRYAAAACVLAVIATVFFLANKKQTGKELANYPTIDAIKPSEIIVQTKPPHLDTTEKITTPEITHPVPQKATTPCAVYVKKSQSKKELPIKKKQPDIDPAQAIINDVDHNYATLVKMQLDRLRITPVYAESPDYFSTFKQQFKQIEADETTIKKDIKQHGLTNELLQQLININQQKLNVLKDLQAEIGKLNHKVQQPKNAQDSSRSYYLNI